MARIYKAEGEHFWGFALYRRTCLICGRHFESTKPIKKYCTWKCRKIVRYKAQQTWRKANPNKIKEYNQRAYAKRKLSKADTVRTSHARVRAQSNH
jgi:hypothetical protein